MGSQSTPLYEAALGYSARGWSVVPLHSIQNGRCTCGRADCSSPGKHPRVDWVKFQERHADEAGIRGWWKRWPGANVGLITGAVSGFFALDVDPDKGGEKSLNGLEAGHGKLPTTTGQLTGGGGRHYLFKHPGQNVDSKVALAPGLDVRGDGGLIVAPPSSHTSGRRYSWLPDAPLAEAPAWLLELILERAPGRPLISEDWAADIPEGERDRELTRRAGMLIGPAKVPAGEALTMLRAVNAAHCKPPLSATQVEKIVRSISSREAAKPTAVERRPAFTVIDYRNFMMEYAGAEVEWLIGDWLQADGVGKIVGPPGSYKTWMLVDLAVSVAGGRPFLGQFRVNRPGHVLFFQQEDGNVGLAGRFNLITDSAAPMAGTTYGIDGDQHWLQLPAEWPIQIRSTGALGFDRPESVELLRKTIKEMRPVLTILDPLYSAVPAKDYAMEAARTMLVIKDIRDEFGGGFILGHHSTKAGREGEREEGWGSQFLNAFDEFQWQVRVQKDGSVRVKRSNKVAAHPPDLLLTFDIRTARPDWIYDVNVVEEKQSVADRIEEIILSGDAPSTMRALAEMVGASVSTVCETAKRMGLVKDGGGRYGIPGK